MSGTGLANRAGTDRHVALLRGINVGGKNKLRMQDLALMFTEAGCTRVETYIQSGNVAFEGAPTLAQGVAALVSERIAKDCGYQIPVVVRTNQELAAIARSDPFAAAGVDPATLLVMFLAEKPSTARIAQLDRNRSPPDEFVVKDREIYLRCPNGLARTRLTNAYFDSALATTSTGRNWRTVLKLLEMTRVSTGD